MISTYRLIEVPFSDQWIHQGHLPYRTKFFIRKSKFPSYTHRSIVRFEKSYKRGILVEEVV